MSALRNVYARIAVAVIVTANFGVAPALGFEWPQRSPSTPIRLAFLPTATTLSPGVIQLEDQHRFDGAVAPAGEPNLYRNALGMTDLGSSAFTAVFGIASGLQAGASFETRWQTLGIEVKQELLRFGDQAPLSMTASLNAQKRLEPRRAESGSAGGGVILQRAGPAWTVLATLAGQTGTLTDTGQSATSSTFAYGFGILYRANHLQWFTEAVIPLQDFRTYEGREPDGLPLLAVGIGIPVFHGILDVLVTNATSVSIGNLLSGPDAPIAHRTMEAHLGIAYRYAFGFDSDIRKATRGP
jgi:hypothetical protein